MTLFDIFLGVIMGGFIWFFFALMLEDKVLGDMKKKKFGETYPEKLSSSDKQSFYIPLALVSVLIGILVAYLGIKGLLPSV
jgi:hypothetical protein